MRNALPLLAALAFAPAAAAQPVPVDLSTWSQRSVSAGSNWVVSSGNSEVRHDNNAFVSFFVSPDPNTDFTLRGTFEVQETGGDDDYIGLVFGYQTPDGSSAANDYDFLLFDWRQENQSSSNGQSFEGFRLLDVDCAYDTSRDSTSPNPTQGDCDFGTFFANRTSPGTGYDILQTNFGSTLGWADNTQYDYELRYSADSVKVTITGGTGAFQNGLVAIELSAADAGVTRFPDGLFGFYNNSQPRAVYQAFEFEEQLPDFTGTVIDVSDCQLPGPPPQGFDFERPSPTDRCFPVIQGVNNLAAAQRYTVFFRIDGTGGAATGFQRVTSRGEIKLASGQSGQNKLSFRTKGSDPDGEYDLVLLVATGSEPKSAALPGGSAVELDRVPFVKGGPAAGEPPRVGGADGVPEPGGRRGDAAVLGGGSGRGDAGGVRRAGPRSGASGERHGRGRGGGAARRVGAAGGSVRGAPRGRRPRRDNAALGDPVAFGFALTGVRPVLPTGEAGLCLTGKLALQQSKMETIFDKGSS